MLVKYKKMTIIPPKKIKKRERVSHLETSSRAIKETRKEFRIKIRLAKKGWGTALTR